jgi:hypothetical protein
MSGGGVRVLPRLVLVSSMLTCLTIKALFVSDYNWFIGGNK